MSSETKTPRSSPIPGRELAAHGVGTNDCGTSDCAPGSSADVLNQSCYCVSFDLSRLRQSLHTEFGDVFSPARRDLRKFHGAIWATRKRLWVDRVASAWLIRRFIDPRATFQWLDKPADCPNDAHGFDFDGAEFTHVEGLVTFEVLVVAFGFDEDSGLAGLARLVHYLDVGGALVPEAAGFEAVLTGLRDGSANDDALLAATSPVLDALYQHFATSSTTKHRTT